MTSAQHRPRHAAFGLERALSDLPDRLLLVLLWAAVAVGVPTVAGQHRPLVVLPLLAVLLAVTWRWRPPPLAADRGAARRAAWGAAACLLFVIGWVVAQLPYTGERLIVSRDPDVYTLTALWLVHHPSPVVPVPGGSDGPLGFSLVAGGLGPQGNHLLPALSAALGWVGGVGAVFAANLVWGGFALLALYALGRRLVGPAWALLPVLALGLSLPMTAFSRSLYSEPLTMALTALAGLCLLTAWRRGRPGDFVLTGVALGAVGLVRVDALLVVVGVVAGLTPLALSIGADGRRPGSRRWATPLVGAGAAPLLLLGLYDVRRYTGQYWRNLEPQLLQLLAVVALVTVAGGVLAAVRLRGLDRWRGFVRRAALPAGATLLLFWALLASRPWWLVSRGGAGNPEVGTLQAAAGLPVDPRRLYDELTLSWLSWYWGPLAVGLGLVGVTWCLVRGLRRSPDSELAALQLLVLPSALLYLTAAGITPDQLWAVRRFMPVVVPGLLLAAVGMLVAAVRPGRWRPARTAAAAVAAVVLVAVPVSTLPGTWTVRDQAGMRAGVQRMCAQIAGRPAVVTSVDTLLPTVVIGCGVRAYGVPHPTPSALRQAEQALGGGPLAVVTRDPGGLPWKAGPPPPIDIRYSELERTLVRRPDAAVQRGTQIVVADVGALALP